MPKTIDLGPVTAYAIAVEQGYSGTEQQWANELANASTNAVLARNAATAANTAKEQTIAVKNSIVNDIVVVQDTQPTAEENRIWVKSDTTEVQIPTMDEFNNIEEDVDNLKSAINTIDGIFDSTFIDVTPSESTAGHYISITGTEAESTSCSYKTISITTSLTGKDFKISGSRWYAVRPYVFVGSSGNIIIPETESTTTPVQYTDLQFTPSETGTLFINVYADQIGKAEYLNIDASSIKVDVLPVNDIGADMTDALDYSIVDLGTLLTSKLLNGETGAITDGTSVNQRVSDYIPVNADTYYLITTEANYARGLYAWYTSDKTFIDGWSANIGSTYTHLFGERIKSPKNAAYIVIGFIYQNPYPFPVLMKGNRVPVFESSKWTGKKWTLIGDSLSAAYTPTGIHYFEMVSGVTGINWVNLGVSGTGYAKGVTNFRVQAQSVGADSDVVTIFGSGNDISSDLPMGTASDTGTETIAGCVNTTLDTLFSINPVMVVGVITPTPWKNNMPYDNGQMKNYANLIVEICKRRSIPCLDLFHCYGLDTNNANVIETAYSRDGGAATHPNEIGQKIIACRIKSFLETLIF